jgi:hypothetical protein
VDKYRYPLHVQGSQAMQGVRFPVDKKRPEKGTGKKRDTPVSRRMNVSGDPALKGGSALKRQKDTCYG